MINLIYFSKDVKGLDVFILPHVSLFLSRSQIKQEKKKNNIYRIHE